MCGDLHMPEKLIPDYVKQSMTFYDKHAKWNRYGFLFIKACQLFISASLPVVALIHRQSITQHQGLITGALGAALLVLEGIQQTLQLQANWIKYRATHNMLRRELNLYENDAGPYGARLENGQTAYRLFTERTDAILASENSEWMALQEKSMALGSKS